MKQKTIEDFNLIADGVLAKPSSVLKLRRDMLARELLRAYESGQQNPVLPEGLPTAEKILHLTNAVDFFTIMIHSGGYWSPTCQEYYDAAVNDSSLPTDTADAEAIKAAYRQAGYVEGVKDGKNTAAEICSKQADAIYVGSNTLREGTKRGFRQSSILILESIANATPSPTDTADAKTK